MEQAISRPHCNSIHTIHVTVDRDPFESDRDANVLCSVKQIKPSYRDYYSHAGGTALRGLQKYGNASVFPPRPAMFLIWRPRSVADAYSAGQKLSEHR